MNHLDVDFSVGTSQHQRCFGREISMSGCQDARASLPLYLPSLVNALLLSSDDSTGMMSFKLPRCGLVAP